MDMILEKKNVNFQIVFFLIFSNLCCRYTLELPLYKAIPMCTYNIWLEYEAIPMCTYNIWLEYEAISMCTYNIWLEYEAIPMFTYNNSLFNKRGFHHKLF